MLPGEVWPERSGYKEERILPANGNSPVAVELIAVLAAVSDGDPQVLTVQEGHALPSGPFEEGHRSLQAGTRSWVERQTGHPLGYIEQLYTFADHDRAGDGRRAISISYLGLTRMTERQVGRRNWYAYFPWEDRREMGGIALGAEIARRLETWIAGADGMLRQQRTLRRDAAFGTGGEKWNEELVLQRYELLYEAGLVAESRAPTAGRVPGLSMLYDHRRILATAIARLRAKIKYRPVVFELMPDAFTLGQLQVAMEALAGHRLHKQNFRRQMEQQELVEETGAMAAQTGGRPAKLYRFRGAVMRERSMAGSKLPLARVP
ncbi:Hypothetical protein GbCGDNIH6_0636 [Granulibacter bethesdensis]|uniref:NUDIX hydrolase n=1 Tax=Granulibacter bethesdensis TaxID=364410 RepID=UPI00090C4A45|nr:hypothetical protein [Granulibacter bethesdensis]APH56442.1 Hypothetical protein GbCGDNIH6_0636 [Granulibacter bethesdensis]